MILTPKEKKFLRIINTGIWIIVAISLPMLFSMLYDSEVQLAETMTKMYFVLDVSEDMCKSGSTIFCIFLKDNEDRIEMIESYNFIFINFESFNENYKNTNEFKTFVKDFFSDSTPNLEML